MEGTSTNSENRTSCAILEYLNLPAILLDSNDIVADANDLALLLFETSRNEFVGTSIFADDDKSHRYKQICEAIKRGRGYQPGKQQTEVSSRAHGREPTYLLKLAQIRIDHDTLGTLVSLYDVSDQHAQQRAHSNLIATLSNELRLPLTSLSLGIELLQRDSRDKSKNRVATAVMEDLGRIRKLSDDLLNKARNGLLSITVRNVTFGFSDLVNSISKRFVFDARQKRVELDVQVEAAIELYGDPVKLAWVISSLIDNALRNTPRGGSILISSEVSGESVRLSVSDRGKAIPRSIVEFALEENTQQLTGNFNCGHRALDLAIANEIIDAHHGRIFVETSPRSTMFIVDLPYVRRV